MPLQPDPNQAYWPLLLTDPLYLLPEDLVRIDMPAAQETQPLPSQQQKSSAATAAADDAAVAAPQPDLVWGSLDRGVLILVDYPNHQLLDRPDGLFLVEVLKAVGFDFKEVATLNVSRCQSAADWAYAQQLPYRHLLSFGVQHQEFSLTSQARLYEQLEHDHKVVLLAEPLAVIRDDVARKKRLWNLLRQAFV